MAKMNDSLANYVHKKENDSSCHYGIPLRDDAIQSTLRSLEPPLPYGMTDEDVLRIWKMAGLGRLRPRYAWEIASKGKVHMWTHELKRRALLMAREFVRSMDKDKLITYLNMLKIPTKSCKCGSYTHLRTNHKDCPYRGMSNKMKIFRQKEKEKRKGTHNNF